MAEIVNRQALARADVLLSMKHGMTRLDNVWGVGGGLRPVTSLVRSMGLLLQEYLSSDDTQEAARCLKELEVPHFHHELVYEAVVLALEAVNEETENSVVKLLKSFCDSTIVTPDQMKNVSFSLTFSFYLKFKFNFVISGNYSRLGWSGRHLLRCSKRRDATGTIGHQVQIGRIDWRCFAAEDSG